MKIINYFMLSTLLTTQCMVIDPWDITNYKDALSQIAHLLFNHSGTLKNMANIPEEHKENDTPRDIKFELLNEAMCLFNNNKESEQKITTKEIIILHSILLKLNEQRLSLLKDVYQPDYILSNHICISSTIKQLANNGNLLKTLSFADYLNISQDLISDFFAKLYIQCPGDFTKSSVLLSLAEHYLPHKIIDQTLRSFGKSLDSLFLNYKHTKDFYIDYDANKSLYSLVIMNFDFIDNIKHIIKHIVDCNDIQSIDIKSCTPEGYFDIDRLMCATPCVENIELNGQNITDFISTSVYKSVKRVSFNNEYMDDDIVKRLFYIFPNLKLMCIQQQEYMVQPDNKLIKLPDTLILSSNASLRNAYTALAKEIQVHPNQIRWNYVCCLLHSLYYKD